MAKIKFYLKNPNETESALFARFPMGDPIIINGKKDYQLFKYYISESIKPEYWNVKTSRAKETRKFPEYPEFNQRLDNIVTIINKTLLNYKNNDETPTKEGLKKELDKQIKPDSIVIDSEINDIKRMNLIEFVDYLIKNTSNKSSTTKSYSVTRKNLSDYQAKHKVILTFKNVDIDFYNSFIKFLNKSGLAKNTIGTRIKILKTFLSNAEQRGLNVCQDFRKKTFAKPNEETNPVYLSISELTTIYQLNNLPKYLDKVRDIFLIGCFTGLRFSDLSKLTQDNITSDDLISIKTQKTGQNVDLPIHPIVKQILEKYEYKLPKLLSNQKFNEYIKDVVKFAGIDEPVNITKTKGNLLTSQNIKKYDLISSHTARRSFATNAFLNDMPAISIMKITGHKTETSFMKYIRMSTKDNALKLKSHKFFNPMLIAK